MGSKVDYTFTRWCRKKAHCYLALPKGRLPSNILARFLDPASDGNARLCNLEGTPCSFRAIIQGVPNKAWFQKHSLSVDTAAERVLVEVPPRPKLNIRPEELIGIVRGIRGGMNTLLKRVKMLKERVEEVEDQNAALVGILRGTERDLKKHAEMLVNKRMKDQNIDSGGRAQHGASFLGGVTSAQFERGFDLLGSIERADVLGRLGAVEEFLAGSEKREKGMADKFKDLEKKVSSVTSITINGKQYSSLKDVALLQETHLSPESYGLVHDLHPCLAHIAKPVL